MTNLSPATSGNRGWALLLGALLLASASPVVAQPTADKGGSRWALLIGVDNYSELGKLRFAGNDQRALAEQLVTSGFPKDQVFLLHDKTSDPKYMPFQANIDRQLDLFLSLAGKDDMVIVSFSGHGVQLEGKSYFCPLDAQLTKLAETSLALDAVYERLNKCPAALKLLVVDACRNDLVPAGRRSAVAARSIGEFGGLKEKPPEGILCLSSCGPGQISMEDDRFNHGVFMHFLLEGLQGSAANASGVVSLAGLYDYVSLETKKHVARKFNEYQTPALKGDIQGPFEICAATPNRPVVNSLGMRLVRISAGQFWMGTTEPAERLAQFYQEPESVFAAEYPAHEVAITKPFYLSACEVTNAQFRAFVEATDYQTDLERDRRGGSGMNPNDARLYDQLPAGTTWRNVDPKATDEHPVVLVSWNDAQAFCRWLGRKENCAYRLPTEAEWEYACRAGTTTRYWSGDDPESLGGVANVPDAAYAAAHPRLDYAAISTNDRYADTAPVGHFRPNPFGLYDMHGNVWEWCQDGYDKDFYRFSAKRDPVGPDAVDYRVIRGGCFM